MIQENFFVKFHSIWDRVPPRGFLNDLKRKCQLDFGDFKDIKTLHVERKDNQRYHMRVCITNKRIIMKLKRAGRLNEDGETYSIRLGNYAVLFQAENQTREKFEVMKLKEAERNKVIMVKLSEQQQILDLMNKLDEYNLKKWEYLSLSSKCAYIGFLNIEEKVLAVQKFTRDRFKVQGSTTGIKIKTTFVSQLATEMQSKKKVEKDLSGKKKAVKKKKKNDAGKKKGNNQKQTMMVSNVTQQPQQMQPPHLMQQQLMQHMMQQNMLQQQMLQMSPAMMSQMPFFPAFQHGNNNSNNRVMSLNDFNILFFPKYQ